MARRVVRPAAVAVALCVWAAAASSASHAGVAARPASQDALDTYRLVETWSDRPWTLAAGRFSHVGDVTSVPGGRLVVLDTGNRALHILSSRGAPRGVFPLPQAGSAPTVCRPRRVDAAPDDGLVVLGTCVTPGSSGASPTEQSYVQRLTADGAVTSTTWLALAYEDVTVAPDGRLLLARIRPTVEPTPEPRADPVRLPGGIDVVAPDGTVLSRIEHPALFYPVSLDAAPDGTLYVANRLPSPWNYEDPGPRPTPPPALLRRQQAAEAVEGVVIFGADHVYVRTEPFTTPEDVAAGPAGAFVSRNVEVFRVGERTPLYAGPPGSLNVGFSDGFLIHLDVPAGGGLHAGLAHCFFQGVLAFGAPLLPGATPELWGALDRPALEGPVHPLRLAADARLALLQGRFLVEGEGAERRYWSGPDAMEPQSVQRWSMGGNLEDQLGVCSGSVSHWLHDRGTAFWTSDVAVGGRDVYTIDRDLLRSRSEGAFPAWSFWPGALAPEGSRSHLTAVAADEARVAVLDAGTRSVYVLDRTGALQARWGLEGAGEDCMPGDVALRGDDLFVADTGRNRILRYDVAGTWISQWPTHDAPWRIAALADGTVLTLGRGGWAMAYGQGGERQAVWPMPDPEADALDIAAGADGRAYVAYAVRRTVDEGDLGGPVVALEEAGVWAFEPAPGRVPETAPGSCWAVTDKTASPPSVRLGDTVDVALRVRGACPGVAERAQVVLLVDTSRSMNWNEAVDRARQMALAVIAGLDPRTAELALVTFDDDAALQVPLTHDVGRVVERVVALEAWGDTRLGAGLAAAVAELEGERAAQDARRLVVVITDGEYTDTARDVAEAARASGIEILAVALPHGGLSSYMDAMVAVTGARWRVLVDPEPGSLSETTRGLAGYRAEDGLFATAEVWDEVPANMRYVAGSAVPPATLRGDTLRWSLADVKARDGISLTYRLEPREVGTWPTNVAAGADYVDALGAAGVLAFPVPTVKVWDMASLVEKAYLPYAARSACFRSKQSLDVVLAIDASESMGGQAETGGTKLDAARSAAGAFVDLLRLPLDRASIVGFNEEARVLAGLSGDRDQLGQALSALRSEPGTRIDRALRQSRAVLERDGRSSAQPVVVLLSDGLHAGEAADVRAEAEALRDMGVMVFAIGLGQDADGALLRDIAFRPDAYYPSASATDLAIIYRRVLESLACLVGAGAGALTVPRPGPILSTSIG